LSASGQCRRVVPVCVWVVTECALTVGRREPSVFSIEGSITVSSITPNDPSFGGARRRLRGSTSVVCVSTEGYGHRARASETEAAPRRGEERVGRDGTQHCTGSWDVALPRGQARVAHVRRDHASKFDTEAGRPGHCLLCASQPLSLGSRARALVHPMGGIMARPTREARLFRGSGGTSPSLLPVFAPRYLSGYPDTSNDQPVGAPAVWRVRGDRDEMMTDEVLTGVAACRDVRL
jgi:hypothetical protein